MVKSRPEQDPEKEVSPANTDNEIVKKKDIVDGTASTTSPSADVHHSKKSKHSSKTSLAMKAQRVPIPGEPRPATMPNIAKVLQS